MQFLVKGHLKNFQRLQIALVVCYGLVKYLVFDKITRFFVVFCCCCCCSFFEIVSVLLCAVTYRIPWHLRLRARFHIRFKRHARRVGSSAPLFNENLCVKNTSKTCREDFTRKRYCELGSLYLPDLTLKDNLENKTTKQTNLRN